MYQMRELSPQAQEEKTFFVVDFTIGKILFPSNLKPEDGNNDLVMQKQSACREEVRLIDYEPHSFYQDSSKTLWNLTCAKFDAIYSRPKYPSDVGLLFPCDTIVKTLRVSSS